MLKVGITYNPSVDLFISGSSQTSILLVELFKNMGSNYDITLINKTSSDIDWWCNFPRMENVTLTQLHHDNTFDILIDVDGYVNPSYRKKLAKKTIVFMRTFLQFSEMDLATFSESRNYVLRSFENVSEIWCWDILNPAETIPAVQTLFPCPIRRVPFIWSASPVRMAVAFIAPTPVIFPEIFKLLALPILILLVLSVVVKSVIDVVLLFMIRVPLLLSVIPPEF